MKLLVFGMGYSSKATARALPTNAIITGTTREPKTGNDADQWSTLKWPSEDAAPVANAISSATHILHSIAPGEDGDPVLSALQAELRAAPDLEWMCYFSTVGVYGNHDGAWIDETAALKPVNKRSQWRVTAEDHWREFARSKNISLCILRLAGIYGPGRSGFDKLAAGTARRINKPGQVFNRIHVDDIARVTSLAAMQKLSGTFNLCDDEPAPPQNVVSFAAELANMPPPEEVPFDQAEMTPMARSFYSDNKRISNAAIKKALGIELLYPTFREGLASIWEKTRNS